MTEALLVGVGGMFGAVFRYVVSRLFSRLSTGFPWATLTVNLLGSYLLGVAIALFSDPQLLQLLGTGFLGAFTTFSTFSYEAFQLMREGKKRACFMYMGISLLAGVLLAGIGYHSV